MPKFTIYTDLISLNFQRKKIYRKFLSFKNFVSDCQFSWFYIQSYPRRFKDFFQMNNMVVLHPFQNCDFPLQEGYSRTARLQQAIIE